MRSNGPKGVKIGGVRIFSNTVPETLHFRRGAVVKGVEHISTNLLVNI